MGAAVPATPKGACSEHCIEIAAPANAVWAVLADFNGWPRWNPLYVETNGSFEVGRKIDFAVALPGMKPQQGSAIVLAVKPGELVEYQMVNAGGLMRAFRYIEIREAGPGRCTVANGEIMGGLLGKLLSRLVGEKVRQGLQGMNEGLKQRIEAGA